MLDLSCACRLLGHGVVGSPAAMLLIPLLFANLDFRPSTSSSRSGSLAAWLAMICCLHVPNLDSDLQGGGPAMRRISLTLWPLCFRLDGVGGTQMHSKWLQGTLVVWLLVEVCSALCSLCQLAQLQLTPTRHRRCRELHYARPSWTTGHLAGCPTQRKATA